MYVTYIHIKNKKLWLIMKRNHKTYVSNFYMFYKNMCASFLLFSYYYFFFSFYSYCKRKVDKMIVKWFIVFLVCLKNDFKVDSFYLFIITIFIFSNLNWCKFMFYFFDVSSFNVIIIFVITFYHVKTIFYDYI